MIDHSREISRLSANQSVGGGRNKLQQRHSQVATVISKGFYNNIQCECGCIYYWWYYQFSSRWRRYFFAMAQSHLLWLISRLLINLISCVLPTEGLDSSWFSTSQHVTGHSISSKPTSFLIRKSAWGAIKFLVLNDSF